MKTLHFIFISLFLLMVSLFPVPVCADMISPDESDRILAGIFNKYIPIYTKYRGVETTSKSIIREYNAATHALKGTAEVVVQRKDYFYEKPEVKVLSFKKDGKDKAPSDYRPRETKQAYLVFDRKGTEHYVLKVMDKKTIGKRECYRIDVLPKKATTRHFKGEIYCAVDTLDLVHTVGGAGDLEFPIKQFWAAFNYMLVNHVSVAKSGTIKVLVDVPVFYPNTLVVTETTILEAKLLE